MKRYLKDAEKGYILITSILVLILVSGIVMGLSREVLTEIMIQGNLKKQKKLFYLAEAGQAYARARLHQDISWAPSVYQQEVAPQETFILNLQPKEKGVKVISRGKISGKEHLVIAEYLFSLNQDPLKHTLLTAGKVEMFCDDTLDFESLFTNKGLAIKSNDLDSKVYSVGRFHAGEEIYFAENIICDWDCLFPHQKPLNVPVIAWENLQSSAQRCGHYLIGNQKDILFKLNEDMPYYIKGNVVLEDMERVFTGAGIVAIEGDLIVKDCILESACEGLVFILVGGKIDIDNSERLGNFKGLLAGEGLISLKGLETWEGLLVGSNPKQKILFSGIRYAKSRDWQDNVEILNKIFLLDKVEMVEWMEGLSE